MDFLLGLKILRSLAIGNKVEKMAYLFLPDMGYGGQARLKVKSDLSRAETRKDVDGKGCSAMKICIRWVSVVVSWI